MGNNIFNISQEYLDIMDLIEANDGEVTPEIEELLKVNQEELDNKFDAYAYIISMKKSNNTMIDDEITRLRSIQQVNNNLQTRLKKTIMETLQLLELNGKSGNYAYKTEFHNFFTRNTEAVELVNEVIPDELLREYMIEYEDLLTYKISKPITLDQLRVIETALLDSGRYSGLVISANITKTNLKEAIVNASYLEADISEEVEQIDDNITKVEFESLSDKLSKLGKIVNNTSLTIK